MSNDPTDGPADAEREAALAYLREHLARHPPVRHWGLTRQGRPSEADQEMSARLEGFRLHRVRDAEGRCFTYLLFVPPEDETAFAEALKVCRADRLPAYGILLMGCAGEEPSDGMREGFRWRFGRDMPPLLGPYH